MFSIFKILKYKYLIETLAIIILMHKKIKLYIQIGNYWKFAKFNEIFIIHYHNK